MKTVISILVFFWLLNSCTDNRSEQRDSAINWSDSEYGIAFNVLVDEANDNYNIFAMNIDGTERRNITNHPDVAWTTDGKWPAIELFGRLPTFSLKNDTAILSHTYGGSNGIFRH